MMYCVADAVGCCAINAKDSTLNSVGERETDGCGCVSP